ncbi:GNAT family N-acetyltransferase [Palleronia sp. KMU-117]|uniref:GNAT family N-acetyltransferase n=1 Tax=Palleronia sp. KMU-117 TaxID=3434108 RepID=UPI003D73D970
MSGLLHLCGADDIDRLLPMVAAYHAFEGIEATETHRRAALEPLLAGSPHGAVWFIGPRRAPVGYVVVTFGWSVEFGGLDGFVDELFIREAVRGRGMGSEALRALIATLAANGLRALHLELAAHNDRARRFYGKLGFAARDRYHLMSWTAPDAG